MRQQALSSKLSDLYYNPATGLSGVNAIYQRAKLLRLKLTKEQIAKFIHDQETSQVFLRRKVKHHYPLVSYSPFSRVQLDLMDVVKWSHWNRGIKFLMCCTDVYTRYSFIVPLKSKADLPVLTAFKKIVKEITDLRGFPPVQLDSDREPSFLSNAFQEFCEDNLITQKLLDTNDFKGTAIVDTFIRTMREYINKYFTAYNTKAFIDVLPDLLLNYNTRINQGIRSTPTDAQDNPNYADNYWSLVAKKVNKAKIEADVGDYQTLKIGERVRVIVRHRKLFDKGTGPKWSKTIHTVLEFKGGLYYVTDRVAGYKVYELQRVSNVMVRSSQNAPRDGSDESDLRAREEDREQLARIENDRNEMKENALENSRIQMERGMRREGLHPLPSQEESAFMRSSRPVRERRQVDAGAFVRQ